jgi:hypothetical protein
VWLTSIVTSVRIITATAADFVRYLFPKKDIYLYITLDARLVLSSRKNDARST